MQISKRLQVLGDPCEVSAVGEFLPGIGRSLPQLAYEPARLACDFGDCSGPKITSASTPRTMNSPRPMSNTRGLSDAVDGRASPLNARPPDYGYWLAVPSVTLMSRVWPPFFTVGVTVSPGERLRIAVMSAVQSSMGCPLTAVMTSPDLKSRLVGRAAWRHLLHRRTGLIRLCVKTPEGSPR